MASSRTAAARASSRGNGALRPLDRPATAHQHLRGPLHRDQAAARAVLVDGGHALAAGVEGELVDPGVTAPKLLDVGADVGCGDEERHLGGIAEVGLPGRPGVVAQDGHLDEPADSPVGGGQRPHRPPQPFEGHLLDPDLVAGQGAGLVGADHGRRPERLDRGQAAHDGMPVGHPLHAARKSDGHHRGQAFGDGGHRQRHRGEEHGLGGLAAQQAGEEHQAGGAQADDGQAPAHPGQLDLEGRGRLLLGEHLGEASHLGVPAGPGDDGPPPARGDRSSGEKHGAPVAQRHPLGHRRHLLGRRERFPGEGGFLGFEAHRHDEAGIGRQPVPRLEHEQVAGDHLGAGHPPLAAVAHDHGFGRRHLLQPCQGALGAGLLHEPQDGIQHHDGEDHSGVDPLVEQHPAYEGGDDQDPDQDVGELVKQDRQAAGPLVSAQGVRSPLLQAAGRLGRGKAVMGIGGEGGQHLVDG